MTEPNNLVGMDGKPIEPQPEAPAPTETVTLTESATAGFPARMREVAQRIAKEDGPSQMGLGQWLELLDAVQHSGRVLLRANPEAAEFAEKYAPKLDGDAGVDIYITQDHTLQPGDYYSIASGICIGMPFDWYAEVRARSSTSKQMIHVFPGIIDPGYTGEIFACVTNLGKQPIELKRGDRLAQLIFHKRVTPSFVLVDDLPKTERGERGFGSTNG